MDLKNKATLKRYFELTDRILKLIDERAAEKMPRGDLQGCVEAVILEAMNYRETAAMKHYVLFIESDIEPNLHGPFKTEEDRDAKARQLRKEEGDFHGIYFLDTEADVSQIEIGTYVSNFFE